MCDGRRAVKSMDRACKECAMRSFHARGVVLALGLVCLASTGRADEFAAPSLLPIPSAYPTYSAFPVTQTGATDVLWDEGQPSPVPAPPADNLPSPSDKAEVISPDYHNAMNGGYGSCTRCAGMGCDACCCGPGYYVYGNALWMTRAHRHGFPISVDTDPVLVLDSCDIQPGWFGGFEVGGGICCNNGCNAIEGVYWGLFPDQESASFRGADATGDLDSVIDFSTLDYDDGTIAGNADLWYDDSANHRISAQTTIHSVEVNFLGNCGGSCGGGCSGGMFGCGINNCYTGCGNRLGAGWLLGFRYFNFGEDFYFEADRVDEDWDGDPEELYYDVDIDNNLWGVQLGGGVNYKLGNCWSLYSVAKFGVYANHSEMYQRVYGSGGSVVANTGDYTGEEFSIDESRNDLAFLGQMDLGFRWQMSQRWSTQFGYRVVGATGVATVEHNIPDNFSNYDGIAEYDVNSSMILHGGFAGVTFVW